MSSQWDHGVVDVIWSHGVVEGQRRKLNSSIRRADTSIPLCRARTLSQEPIWIRLLDPHHGLCGDYCCSSHLRCEEMQDREVKRLVQRHTARKWQSQDPNCPAPRLLPFSPSSNTPWWDESWPGQKDLVLLPSRPPRPASRGEPSCRGHNPQRNEQGPERWVKGRPPPPGSVWIWSMCPQCVIELREPPAKQRVGRLCRPLRCPGALESQSDAAGVWRPRVSTCHSWGQSRGVPACLAFSVWP